MRILSETLHKKSENKTVDSLSNYHPFILLNIHKFIAKFEPQNQTMFILGTKKV